MAATRRPTVSVVMPVRNEASWIERCLDSVVAQDYPSDLTEVIVADGRSTDGTREIVEQVRQRIGRDGGPAVVVVDNPGRIVPTALNVCLGVARGDVIIRVDGHCEISRDYVRRCVDALASTGADNVGGVQRAVGDGIVGRAIAAAMSSQFGVGGARFHYATRPGWVDTVFLGAYPRTVFDRIGGFDEDLVRNQDDELNFRLQQAGGRIWLDPSIVTIYRPRASVGALWRQYFGYGFYKALVMRKRRGLASLRQLAPPAFVGGGVASLVSVTVTRRWLIPATYFGAYVFANLTAAAVHRGRLGISRGVLPLAFAIMHVAYGAGFLIGVVRWGLSARRA